MVEIPMVVVDGGGGVSPLVQIVGSESVGVNGMRAEAHQLVNPAGLQFVEFSLAIVGGKADGFLQAVSHVGDQLVVGAVRKEHGSWGVRLAGEWSSPMSLR